MNLVSKGAFIKGTGSYVPSKVLTNRDIEKLVDTSDEWIVKRTGIRERRIAGRDQVTSDLALEASRIALDEAGLEAKDLELIVMATITPDTHCPAGANMLESKLGAVDAVSFDVTAACSGFLFALGIAMQFLSNGTFRNALVVASEVMSRTVNWQDRTSCILWGDGSGAVVLSSEGMGPEILSLSLHTDGSMGHGLLMPGGGSATTPISHESVDKGLHYLQMKHANMFFKVAVRRFAEACEEAVREAGINLEDVSLIVPHQANLRIIQAMARKLNFPMEKVWVNIDTHGNSSSATVPIGLDEAYRSGKISNGDKVLLVAFGGGLTWGSCLIEWHEFA